MNAAATPSRGTGATLALRYLGIDTYQHYVVYARAECPVCRSEGFTAQSRVEVRLNGRSLIATLNVVKSDLLEECEVSLSESAWRALGAHAGEQVSLAHPPHLDSIAYVRGKVHGKRFTRQDLSEIVRDIVAGRYSDMHLAAFITACAGDHLDIDETLFLTEAMIDAGERLVWPAAMVMDKHCVGGLPGNRTTPIVVAIVAAHGLMIPKTSSRAITSPAGTADTMETLAPVELSSEAMRRVVEKEGGCVVWGGTAGLSPADDLLVRVERPLELDSEGQMVASVLSKKASAGATHVVIDIPVGPTAKVRSRAAAELLCRRFEEVGRGIGIVVRVVFSDGLQPVGRGIGPALEAHDVLSVLRCEAVAPLDLRARSLALAAAILEASGAVPAGLGMQQSELLLDAGQAWKKFQAICEAQGGMRVPGRAAHVRPVLAGRAGTVSAIDNRRLSRAARLAGAPRASVAGVRFLAPLGTRVERGQPLFELHAQAPGELDYAMDYVTRDQDIVTLT
jgi:thymidine phosphorylase